MATRRNNNDDRVDMHKAEYWPNDRFSDFAHCIAVTFFDYGVLDINTSIDD